MRAAEKQTGTGSIVNHFRLIVDILSYSTADVQEKYQCSILNLHELVVTWADIREPFKEWQLRGHSWHWAKSCALCRRLENKRHPKSGWLPSAPPCLQGDGQGDPEFGKALFLLLVGALVTALKGAILEYKRRMEHTYHVSIHQITEYQKLKGGTHFSHVHVCISMHVYVHKSMYSQVYVCIYGCLCVNSRRQRSV